MPRGDARIASGPLLSFLLCRAPQTQEMPTVRKSALCATWVAARTGLCVAHPIRAIRAKMNTNSADIESLRSFFGHDLRYWKGIADSCLIFGLFGTGIFAFVIVASTWLSMRWADEIDHFQQRKLEAAQQLTDVKVAEAAAKGIDAGKVAGDAQARISEADAKIEHSRAQIEAANVEIEKQKAIAADFQKQAAESALALEQLKAQTSQINNRIADRMFSPDQQAAFIRELMGSHRQLNLLYPNGDGEAQRFAMQVSDLLARAGWYPNLVPAAIDFGQPRTSGIMMMDGATARLPELVKALAAAGHPVERGPSMLGGQFMNMDPRLPSLLIAPKPAR